MRRFAMRLALAFGRPDVDRFMAGLSSRQLAEWDAFERIEGFIGSRTHWDVARHLALVMSRQKVTHGDFMPWLEKPEMTPAAFRAQFKQLLKPKPKR